MPIREIESHPFLELQSGQPDFNPAIYQKLLIGTFPVYEITDSVPQEQEGRLRKQQWERNSYFRFFYGSRKNSFWRILADNAGVPFPAHTGDCIRLLNSQGVYITDMIKTTERVKYSSSDTDLVNTVLNPRIPQLITALPNLQRICFTSDFAKTLFCQQTAIQSHSRIQETNISGRSLMLFTLPTPAGNGRTVRHYFGDYPPSAGELERANGGLPYAISYRSRIYREFLAV